MKIKKLSIIEILASIFFAWNLMPVFCAEYVDWQIRFIFFFLIVVATFLGIIQKGVNCISKNGGIIICIMLFLFFIMRFFREGDAASYFNVMVTFWIIYIFNSSLSKSQSEYLCKYILVILFIIAITSLLGLLVNTNAARIISYATGSNDIQIALSKKNIAGMSYFQSLVLLVPGLIAILQNLKKQKYTYRYIIFMMCLLLKASFSIALLIYIITLGILICRNIVLKQKSGLSRITLLLMFILIFLCIIFKGGEILYWFSSIIDNTKIIDRLQELINMFYGSTYDTSGDVFERASLYLCSLETFKEHYIFGVGPHYTFIKMQDGIGYHSQIIDDMARYGVSALLFYIIFFRAYYRMLIINWKKIGCEYVAYTTVCIYIVLLLLNIGFRSIYENTIAFVVIPNLPLIILKNNSKFMKKGMKNE